MKPQNIYMFLPSCSRHAGCSQAYSLHSDSGSTKFIFLTGCSQHMLVLTFWLCFFDTRSTKLWLQAKSWLCF